MSEQKTSTPMHNDNPEMALADAYIRQTGSHVYLTGKAGSGKTTFLHSLQRSCSKQMIVTAPTGVAAINAGGVTLHSFFQLPFGPFIPGQSSQDRQRLFRMTKEKKRIIKGLDLLVIDEISMVRADTLDAVDHVLRQLRRSDAPFGGVQLLLIGDLYQLPPVVRPEESNLLSSYYPSAYFFASQALAKTELVTVELKKVYRQSDERFIDILNAVRENRLSGPALEHLNQCAHKSVPDQGAITLTTHNYKADQINQQHLEALSGDVCSFQAEVSGDFPESSYPTADRLTLKVGAQVMFVKNDPSPEKLYYNGKIGQIVDIVDGNRIVVRCEPEAFDAKPQVIDVEPVAWKNMAYSVDETDQSIQETVAGEFSQVPLKLAWAVTIHKSQGLTFDRAIVDAADAFAHGQAYVALSRCRSLDGLVLSSPIGQHGLQTDAVVDQFMASAVKPDELGAQLHQKQVIWQQQLLWQCFNASSFKGLFSYLVRLLETNSSVIQLSGINDVNEFRETAEAQIFSVSDKFLNQLSRMFATGAMPESDAQVRERIQKASAWIGEKMNEVFGEFLEKGSVEADNKALLKQIRNAIDNLKQAIRVQRAGILACADGFQPEQYLRAISQASIETTPGKATKQTKSQPEFSEMDIEHAELFNTLKAWRSAQAQEQAVPAYRILHQKVLVQLCIHLPDTEAALLEIKGVSHGTVARCGKQLLEIVNAYRLKHNIEEVILPEPSQQVAEPDSSDAGTQRKEPKGKAAKGPNTKEVSFNFFNQGMTLEQIAEHRGLALSTIQGHLGYYVGLGELDIRKLVDVDTQQAIEAVLEDGLSIGEIKRKLDDSITYGEIQLVLADRKRNSLNDQD